MSGGMYGGGMSGGMYGGGMSGGMYGNSMYGGGMSGGMMGMSGGMYGNQMGMMGMQGGMMGMQGGMMGMQGGQGDSTWMQSIEHVVMAFGQVSMLLQENQMSLYQFFMSGISMVDRFSRLHETVTA